ncbi:MAG: hypothetical protein P1V97_12895, partial [Planctomycetota bacterium]|nr:hypothetical protein [Planctomycetota bacterium]
TGPRGPFYEELERIAADNHYVIMTMQRIHYFDEMAFSIFMRAQSILRHKGGDLLLSSLKRGNIAALQMIVGNVFEIATNIFENEEDALAEGQIVDPAQVAARAEFPSDDLRQFAVRH